MPNPDKQDKPEAPSLRSLSPIFDEEQHGTYVDILEAELSKLDETSPRNIALTGHYGSGKSSVLGETKRRLADDGVNVINLSLPSLSLETNPTSSEKGSVPDVTNRIQKEIVKQLLYRQKPSSTPASRFNRLDTFATKPAYFRAGIVSTSVTSFAILLKLPETVHSSLPAGLWGWLDTHLWSGTSLTLQWLSLLLVFSITFAVAMWAQQLLQQRHVTELAAGPAKVALSGPATSYFDEYLDEIVYFFQTSKTAVVIFEDLDRFKDPHIFETLRELNLLLNNAEQTGTDSICFVYAIRDSVFEQLDSTGDTSIPANEGNSRRLISTNRTKFFDLVVPMVPFISHRTSRDLIDQELKTVESSKRPGKGVIEVVGAHLTDMRLIKNICNEYEIFQRRILGDKGLNELTPDRLFASIVYKNLYLSDYEKIRDGASRLDSLYAAFRQWVSHQSAQARDTERQYRTRLRQLDSIQSRSTRLGKRLAAVLTTRQPGLPPSGALQVTMNGEAYSADDIKTADFWRTWLETGSDLTVPNAPSNYGQPTTANMPLDLIQVLLGESLSPDEWAKADRSAIITSIEEAAADQRKYAQISMMDALAETTRTFNYGEGDKSVLEVAEQLFENDGLIVDLLRTGHIDENFTLYITQFPGHSISASAMNFIIKSVQADREYLDYHFGTGKGSNAVDIQSVIDAEPVRTFSGRSVYNIEIFDYLLESGSGKLDEPIRRLALGAANDLKFIDAYMTSGKQTEALVRRLSARWPDIFDYLIGDDQDSLDHKLLSAAFEGATPTVTYTIDEAQTNAIAGALLSLDVTTRKQESKRATEIAKVIDQLGIRAPELAGIAEPLRNELVLLNLYPLSASNLSAIFADDQSRLPLDRIKSRRPNDVYVHALDDLDEYLEAISELEDVPTVAEVDSFTEILADVGARHPDSVTDVARRAKQNCEVEDLTELDVKLWPYITQARRLRLNANNLTTYIDQLGVDEPLASYLAAVDRLEVEQGDELLNPLALKLLNAESLADDTKRKIVLGMNLGAASITAATLEPTAHSVLPSLIASAIVNDDVDAYSCLSDSEWRIKEQLIVASTTFVDYMMNITLSQTDLEVIGVLSVAASVKRKTLDNLSVFESYLTPKAAVGLAKWAAQEGHPVESGNVLILASKGGPGTAESVLTLLAAEVPTMNIDVLKQILTSLSGTYRKLAVHGRDRPSVPANENMELVLKRLQAEHIVSKWKVKRGGTMLEVSKLRS